MWFAALVIVFAMAWIVLLDEVVALLMFWWHNR